MLLRASGRLGFGRLKDLAQDLRTTRQELLGMDIGEYQHRAAQLSFYASLRMTGEKTDKELDLAVLGMTGEFLSEVEDHLSNSRWTPTSALEEEFGDFMWYLALYATWHDVALSKWAGTEVRPKKSSSMGNRTVHLNQLRRTIGVAAERAKKYLHGSQKPFEMEAVEDSICKLYVSAIGIMLRCRLEPSKVYARNIQKLELRSHKQTTYEVVGNGN